MRRRIAYATLLLLAVAAAAGAQEAGLAALIVDTAGTTTEVNGLAIGMESPERYALGWQESSSGALVVRAGVFEVAIPLRALVSFVMSGAVGKAVYVWNGKEVSAEGQPLDAEITAASPFGEFSLSVDKVKKLEMKPRPALTATVAARAAGVRATLRLAGGSAVQVTGLKRVARYYSTEGYVFGGVDVTGNWENVPFMRGESKATVKMAELSRVEFGPDAAISVQLRNGAAAAGTLASGAGTISGFCGVSDAGYFFVDVEHVKSIDFGG